MSIIRFDKDCVDQQKARQGSDFSWTGAKSEAEAGGSSSSEETSSSETTALTQTEETEVT